MGSGIIIEGITEEKSVVKRILIGGKADMKGVLNVGDVVQHPSSEEANIVAQVDQETKSNTSFGSLLMENKETFKWVLLNAPSEELRKKDPEQWSEVLYALGDSDEEVKLKVSKDGDLIFKSTTLPPATLVWKYTKACKAHSKRVFGRIMMTRPYCKSYNVSILSKKNDEEKDLESEIKDTACTLRKSIQDAKTLNLSVSGAFKKLRRHYKSKERKYVFRKSSCLGERGKDASTILINEMFPILSSNHIDSESIIRVYYVKFHRVEDKMKDADQTKNFKGLPYVVLNANGSRKTSTSKSILTRNETRVFEWSDEILLLPFTAAQLLKRDQLEFSLMDTLSGKVKSWTKSWDELSITSDVSSEENLTVLEFENRDDDEDGSSGSSICSLHVSISECRLAVS